MDQPEKSALLIVRDEGVGIPQDDLPHIFGRFRRAANTVGRFAGTGLGLASARELVELHGGTITVESEEGQGSTFVVRLPLTPPAKASLSRE
jgi:signal transduction histidine kinase